MDFLSLAKNKTKISQYFKIKQISYNSGVCRNWIPILALIDFLQFFQFLLN